MSKFLIISLVLLLIGAICFAVAGYFYWRLHEIFELLSYYSLEEQYYSNPRIAADVWNLKFGIIRCSIIGFASWMLSIIFFLKRKKA